MLAGTFSFVNASGETAPPGCVLEPTGVLDADGRIEVRKATADDQLGVFINSLAKVGDGEAGVCFAPFPGVVFGVHTSDALAARDPVGTQAGDWYLRKGRKGYLFVGGDPAGTRFGNAVPEPAAAGTGGLTTANTDGTEESATTDLRFDKTTGVRVTKGATDADPDVVSLIAASPTQMGAVTTGVQAFAGGKIFRDPISVTNEASAPGYPAPRTGVYFSMDDAGAGDEYATGYMFAELSAVFRLTVFGGSGTTFESLRLVANHGSNSYTYTQYDATSAGSMLAGAHSAGGVEEQGVKLFGQYLVSLPTTPEFDIYGKASEWSGGSGPIRHRQNEIIKDGKAWGAERSGTDYPGVDDTLSACHVGQFYAGLLVSKELPSSTTPLSTDSITVCRSGVPYRCTIAALKTLLDSLDAPPPP